MMNLTTNNSNIGLIYKHLNSQSKTRIQLKSILLFLLLVPMQSFVLAQTFSLKEYKTGDSLLRENKFDASISIFQHILTCRITDSIKAEIFYRKGYILYSENNKDSAINYYQMALELFKNDHNPTRASRVYRYMAILNLSIKNYDDALLYNYKALSYAQLAFDSLTCYFEICKVYATKKEFKRMYNIIVKNIRPFNDSIIQDQSYLISSDLGQYYKSIKQYDSALYSYKKALSVARYEEHITASYGNISDVYKDLKNYRAAISYQDSAYYVNSKSGNQQMRLYIYDGYKGIYNDMGDVKNAFKYSELARNISDTIFKVEESKAIEDGNIKYKTKQIEDDNKLKDKDILLKQRNFIYSLIGLALVALLAGITFRSYKQKQKANNILTAQKEQVQQLANELEVANQTKARLFSTIGHDLRSPISSLYALLKMQEIKGGSNTIDAATMSSQTIHLLDTLEDLLVWSKTQMDRFVPMPVLVDISWLYEELTGFFAGTAVEKNVTIINEVVAAVTLRCDENILRTMLRNAIGNAISHTATGESVVITAKKEDNKVICGIKNQCSENDFENFQSAFADAGVGSGSHGLGLVLIKEFAEKIGASVNIQYADGWVAMQIYLPA